MEIDPVLKSESNVTRRKLSMEFTGKSDIKDNSRICEFHFSESQFEAKREDGRRLLKPNAIPDLLNKENCPCVSVTHEDKPRQETIQ
ncbi:hypothetical protein ABEB36_009360 [Hypothenemus hampei]|uniref:THAP-type domain-containing protein n=1 Tax=Hypothenemus hampei TaxID=57062 RepID=A0ABD1EG40_HYPHA